MSSPTSQLPTSTIESAAVPKNQSSTQSGPQLPSGTAAQEGSANFWREFLYWWTAHCPFMVRLTRPFFLWFAFRFSKALKDGPTANARRILGERASPAQLEALRRRMVRNAYMSIYELGVAVRASERKLADWVQKVDGSEHYVEARKAKKGAIVLTAHLGPFEIGASALTGREDDVYVVYRRDDRASFDRMRSRLREKLGLRELSVDDGWSIWGRIREVLEGDGVVMIQGDRVMPGQKGIAVPFFDGHILLPTGPLKLAMVTGSPIIPIFSARTRVGRCHVWIQEPIFVTREDGAVGPDHPAMQRIARAIERQVKACPDQWAVYERAWCEDRVEETRPTKALPDSQSSS